MSFLLITVDLKFQYKIFTFESTEQNYLYSKLSNNELFINTLHDNILIYRSLLMCEVLVLWYSHKRNRKTVFNPTLIF